MTMNGLHVGALIALVLAWAALANRNRYSNQGEPPRAA